MASTTPKPTRRSQPERSAATREALITAARPLFAAHGFANVGTEAIVAAAAVTRGAMYHQFADKTALFAAVLETVEAGVAEQLVERVTTAGVTEPVAAMRLAARAWLDACAEPDVRRIVLVDGPSVLGWARWRALCQRYVFRLVHDLLAAAMDTGRVPRQPVAPLTHLLLGASDEAALYVAESADPDAARTEMIAALDHLINGLTVPSVAS